MNFFFIWFKNKNVFKKWPQNDSQELKELLKNTISFTNLCKFNCLHISDFQLIKLLWTKHLNYLNILFLNQINKYVKKTNLYIFLIKLICLYERYMIIISIESNANKLEKIKLFPSHRFEYIQSKSMVKLLL